MKTIQIVIPCYNEQDNLKELLERLEKLNINLAKVDIRTSYLFVDDGSTDTTYDRLIQFTDTYSRIKIIKLSRNYGSHISISAGIEHSIEFDAVVVLPSDLQEPPEHILNMVTKWLEGYEVILSIREKRAQSLFGKMLSRGFHKLLTKFSSLKNYPKEGSSAFFLLDKKVSSNWIKFTENNRMINGLVTWMGFKQAVVSYKQEERFSGKSSWGLMQLVKMAIDSFVSFSYAPIRFITYLGLFISIIGFGYALVLIYNKIFLGVGPEGWTSIMIIILILGGIQLITLGIIGEYVWRGVDESRKRPLYLVSEKINFKDESVLKT